jgi:hypothetical protein
MEYYKRHYSAATLICTRENLEEIKNFYRYFTRTGVVVDVDGENITIKNPKNMDVNIENIPIGATILFNGRTIWSSTIENQKRRFFGYREISKNEYYEIASQNISLLEFDNFKEVKYFAFCDPVKIIKYNGTNKNEIEKEFKLNCNVMRFRDVEYLRYEIWNIRNGDNIDMNSKGKIAVYGDGFKPFHLEPITENEYKEFMVKIKEHLALPQ